MNKEIVLPCFFRPFYISLYVRVQLNTVNGEIIKTDLPTILYFMEYYLL